MRPIIKQGQTFTAEWEGKEQNFKAEADKIVIDRGSYIELMEKAYK